MHRVDVWIDASIDSVDGLIMDGWMERWMMIRWMYCRIVGLTWHLTPITGR